ncbi:hypothetical protein [uncultured Jatrophihabitans sp.]|uniref:hypothetical protein n=1 Tax=uncultured Jatrophihabitans sp. TaxID=1610747 RepID=UPI0035CCA807
MTLPSFAAAQLDALHELAPLLRRCVELQSRAVARIRVSGASAGVLVRLPFGVLVSRTVLVTGDPASTDPAVGTDQTVDADTVVEAAQLLAWLDDPSLEPPQSREHEWRTGVPPTAGWRRVETVPDDVIRPLVRKGALALKDAAAREGVPGAQPRAEVADALLDSVVLTIGDTQAPAGPDSIEITLRALSALTRMGFLTRGGPAHVDVAGRWVRVVGGYGTVYLERPGSGLDLRPASRPG